MYPFERNRYFYGKLLTVRDFESEQKYFNDKRRLLNRLLFGSGVVAGMQVVAVDDKTITVENGVALDYLGREIVIPAPVTLKLSMIDGFTNNEYKKNVYLYVAYDEKGREPVHSVGSASARGDEVSEYNRYLESYRLYIKEEAPAPDSFEHAGLMETIAVLHQDSDIRITARMPKYANPGEVVDVTLVVEKTLQTPRISLNLHCATDGFELLGQDGDVIRFLEPGEGQDTEYRHTFSLKTADRVGTFGRISFRPEDIELSVGDNRIPVEAGSSLQSEIIARPVAERILKDWYERTLDQAVEGYSDQDVCLAKIGLLQLGPTYMIEQVERVPFGEYIPNASLQQRLHQTQRAAGNNRFYTEAKAYDVPYGSNPELDVIYDDSRNAFEFKLGIPKPQTIQDEMATGVIEVPLDGNAKSGLFSRGQRSHVTDEIVHGLGKGQVTVLAGLEELPQAQSGVGSDRAGVYFGSAEVFKGTEFEPMLPDVKFGTLIYPDKGTFRIGLRLAGGTEAEKLRIRWWAFKKLPDGAAAAAQPDWDSRTEAEAASAKER
jgi:hypothetical protein